MPARRKRDRAGAALAAALRLAGEEGWRAVTPARVAEEAGLPLDRMHALYPSRAALLDAFAHSIDRAVLADGPVEGAASARERLFEVMMRRFDALRPHRRAVRAIAAASAGDPCAMLAGAARLHASMGWMLEAAAIASGGLGGGMRAAALAAIHLDVLRLWLNDDSDDMAKTMAALDRRLARAEAAMMGCRRWRQRGEGDPESGDSAPSDRQQDADPQPAQG